MEDSVVVYSTPGCTNCDHTLRWLNKANIQAEVIDLSQDHDAMLYVQSLGYKEAPVVEAGDKHWSGFRYDKLKELQAEHRPQAA